RGLRELSNHDRSTTSPAPAAGLFHAPVGMKSSFLRDAWLVFDGEGPAIATMTETGSCTPVIRRYGAALSAFAPVSYSIAPPGGGEPIATIRQHFNWLVYKLGVTVHREDDQLDDLMLLSGASLIAAIGGRQR